MREPTYKCWRCFDLGYQSVWSFRRGRWRQVARPCSCETAPAVTRSADAIEPSDVWIRGEFGDLALANDLLRFGAPNAGFTKWVKANKAVRTDDAQAA